MIGNTIGRYRIDRQVGAGGMGVVYQAFDMVLNRQVAIKTLADRRRMGDTAIARLKAEALAVASLNHPYICGIYELVDDGLEAFIVMELVEGETLEAKLRRGPLPVAETLRVGREIAEGLSDAHAHGLVHRDIKPSNVMVTPHGHVKLLDFGLALPDTASGPNVTTRTDEGPGDRAGTPSYMAPEQAQGRAVTARVDVFAFGVLLFECLAGELPFDGLTTREYLDDVVSQTPKPLERLAPATPPDLVALLARCLDKDPGGRPASAAVLATELRRLEHVELTRASEQAAARARRLARRGLLAAGLVGLVVIAAAVLLLLRGQLAPRPHEVESQRPVVNWSSDESVGRLSPDGRWVSFISNHAGRSQLYYQATIGAGTVGAEAQLFNGCSGELLSQVWAPDSDRVACVARINGEYFVQVTSRSTAANRMPSVPLEPPAGLPRALRWIGASIYLQFDAEKTPRGLYRLTLDDRRMTNVAKDWQANAAEFDVRPDGKVVFSVMTLANGEEREDLWTADLEGRHRTQITDDASVKHLPLWVGEQDFVVYQSNRDGRSALWEVSTASRKSWPLSTQAPAEPQSSSLDGSWLTIRQASEVTELYRYDAGGKVDRLTQDNGRDFSPSLSRDGRVLAYQQSGSAALQDSPYQNARVRVADMNGAVMQGAQDYGPGFYPVVSPLGTAIAYAQGLADSISVWRLVLRDRRTGVSTTVTSAMPFVGFRYLPGFNWLNRQIAWLPDDSALYFVEVDQANAPSLRRHQPGSPLPAAVVFHGLPGDRIRDLAPSADGRGIAFLVVSASAMRLHVLSFDTTRDQITDLPSKTAFFLAGWRRSGSLILLREDGGAALTVLEVTGGVRMTPVSRLSDALVRTGRLDATGSTLFYTSVAGGRQHVAVLELATGVSRTLVDAPSEEFTFSSAAPLSDGAVIVPRGQSTRDVWLIRLKRG